MAWVTARKFLNSLRGQDTEGTALSRRDMLAGLGLVGLLVAAPKMLVPGVAEAATLDAPAAAPAAAIDRPIAEQRPDDSVEATDLSAQRWRRRRRYWRRRYYRPRYYIRPRYRRRYWRRRRYW